MPIPILSTELKNSNDAPIFSVPNIDLSEQEVDLLPMSLDQLKLNLKLAFKDGKLGLLIEENQEFIAFDSVLLQQIGIIGVGVFQGDTD